MILCGLDIASRLTGFCVGDGSATPIAGAWAFPHVGDEYGELGAMLWRALDALHRDHGPIGLLNIEAPIIVHDGPKTTGLRTGRVLYGMSFLVETWGVMRGVPSREAGIASLKRELGGKHNATKDDMVFAAERCGVRLPATIAEGRRDAADAFAAWLIAVRHYARQHQSLWDRRLYSPRGALPL